MKDNNENNMSINNSVLNESSYPLTDKKASHTKRSSAFELLLESHKEKDKTQNLNNSSNANLLKERSFSGSIDEIMSKNKEEDLKEKLKFESNNKNSTIKNSTLRNASSLKSSSSVTQSEHSTIIEDKYEQENRILKKVEKIENSDSENEASDEEVHINFFCSFILFYYSLFNCF